MLPAVVEAVYYEFRLLKVSLLEKEPFLETGQKRLVLCCIPNPPAPATYVHGTYTRFEYACSANCENQGHLNIKPPTQFG